MSYYEIGSHNVQCDTCKKILKRSQAKKDWRGHIQCLRCFDPKHPNDLPRVVRPDGEPVVDARPQNNRELTSLELGYTTRWDDVSLLWNDIHWRWDDDKSRGNMFGNANNTPE